MTHPTHPTFARGNCFLAETLNRPGADLMESARCNGGPESWIRENAGVNLKRAENRPFGTTPLGTWGSA